MSLLGLVSISFRNLSPEEIISEAKNAGLACIEWGSDIHAPRNDYEKLNLIAELQKKNDIFCCSYGTYFRLGRDNTEELTEYISAAKTLGTDILRLWCGTKASSEYTPDEERQLFDECKKGAAIAEKHGVILCMECHNGTYTDTKEGAIKLMQQVSSPALRMYWQPNQFTDNEENKRYARLLSSFTKNIHVFNWSATERFPLGDAVDLWKEYLSYFNKNQTLLLEFMPDDKISSLKAEAQSLRKIAE